MSKKSFIDSINPVTQFISTQEEAAPATDNPTIPPPGYKVDPRFIETKSKRMQVLMQPSLHKRLQKLARKKKTSVNDLIHTFVESSVKSAESAE